MKLIESKAELVLQQEGLEGVYKQIEFCGRTCYKSEDKITEESAKPFVDRMIASNHLAMLEHGTIYLKISLPKKAWFTDIVDKYYHNPYSKVNNTFDDYDYHYFITTNYRVLVENNWLDDLKYLCGPTELHEKRYTIKFTCSRDISHELVRHRVFSFAQESQRYCNYSKERHGGEITFIIPSWYDETKIPIFKNPQTVIEKNMVQQDENSNIFEMALRDAEIYYLDLLVSGATPQEARAVLPNATKTEICMTGFASDWRHFFDLRLFGKTGAPHPDMLVLANKAKEAAEEAGIWEDIMRYKSKFN